MAERKIFQSFLFTLFSSLFFSVGHFVTRTIATYWQLHLPAGKNVSELKDQGYPNGINALSIIQNAVKNRNVSVSAALIDGIAGKEGVSESWQILLANGSTTTLWDRPSAQDQPASYRRISSWPASHSCPAYA
jgi:hypothetical protein